MEVGLLLLVGGVAAGAFGSLLGLGGGLLIVPLLTIGFGLPLREAVGVSLVCVIVTSSASAGVYLQRRQANLRLGMVLELFTGSGRSSAARSRSSSTSGCSPACSRSCSCTWRSRRSCAAPDDARRGADRTGRGLAGDARRRRDVPDEDAATVDPDAGTLGLRAGSVAAHAARRGGQPSARVWPRRSWASAGD